MKPLRRFAVPLFATLAGCSSQPAIDVHLTVDPNLDTEAQLVAALDHVLFVVDSDRGLYPPGSERSTDTLQIKNADADPALELLITTPMPEDHLPFLRLERGSLPLVPLAFRVFGIAKGAGAAGTYVARGDVGGIGLGDPATQVALPFNLRPELREPRVDQVLPSDGATIEGCALPPLIVQFSRPMSPASLKKKGVVVISPDPGPISIFVDGSGLVANVVASSSKGPGPTLDLHLHVSAEATDTSGQALDQSASAEGQQAFDADLRLVCGPPPTLPTPPDCVAGLNCGRTLRCLDGACVPASCSACAAGFVCDSGRAACVPDCRTSDVVGACLPMQSCQKDGVCR